MFDDMHAHASRLEAAQREHDLDRLAPMVPGAGPSRSARLRVLLARIGLRQARRRAARDAAMRSADAPLGAPIAPVRFRDGHRG